MFPTVNSRYGSCKTILQANHLAVNNKLKTPNHLQNKVNKERRQTTIPLNFEGALDANGKLSLNKLDFVPPRKSSCGQFMYNTPKTPFHVSKTDLLIHNGSVQKMFVNEDWPSMKKSKIQKS
mmetsp:Transcript_24284/g.21553  ORF Transcript_24284/g.21553 Transcript_24284/m.21553 type:complete len:122 (+) Transcript_24284:179-544(+)